MAYDDRQQPNSSGTLVVVIGVGLVLAILAIIAVAGVGLFWVRASTQQAIVMEQRAIAARAEAQRDRDLSQLEQSLFATGPGPSLKFVLELDRDGIMSVGGEGIDLNGLKARLAKLKEEASNTSSVQINADPECPVKYIVPVLDVCEEIGDIDYRIVASANADAPIELNNIAN
jgi:biopolymer transport protein ExbD